jgi:hypothetical protein
MREVLRGEGRKEFVLHFQLEPGASMLPVLAFLPDAKQQQEKVLPYLPE